MKRNTLLTTLILIAFVLMNGMAMGAEELDSLKKDLENNLSRMDEALRIAAEKLEGGKLDRESTAPVLSELYQASPFAIDCSLVNAAGVLKIIMPVQYGTFEDTDISEQLQVRQVKETGKPALSGVFISIEGIPGMDAEYPLSGKNGEFRGSVSILFSPVRFFGDMIIPLEDGLKETGRDVSFHVIRNDGICIYSRDRKLIGVNIIEKTGKDSVSGWMNLIKAVTEKETGEETLCGGAKERLFWDTVNFYGSVMRILMVEKIGE